MIENAHRLQIKLLAQDGLSLDVESLIPIFHDWIKHHRLNELLIDVTTYAHVPQGPGVGIIGHESDYFFDEADGHPGLLYTHKRHGNTASDANSNVGTDLIVSGFRRALFAASLLEQESAPAGKLRFRTDELLFRAADRLVAPSNDESFAAARRDLQPACDRIFGPGAYELQFVSSPRQVLTVRIRSSQSHPLSVLLERAEGAPAAV